MLNVCVKYPPAIEQLKEFHVALSEACATLWIMVQGGLAHGLSHIEYPCERNAVSPRQVVGAVNRTRGEPGSLAMT